MKPLSLFLVSVYGASTALGGNPFGIKYDTKTVEVGDQTYQYITSEPSPEITYKGTIFLLHGFPDLAYGWHNQLPFLNSLGYRVVAPNLLGYAGTSSPQEIEPYYVKNMAADVAELIRLTGPANEEVILGGHDWGAILLWQTVVRYPNLFKAVFALAVPPNPPAKEYVDLADTIKAGKLLNFGYQLQLREPKFDKVFQGTEGIRKFLRGVYGGTTPKGEPVVSERYGVNLTLVDKVQPAPLLPRKIEDFYAKNLVGGRKTMHGPLSWYRTAKANWEDSRKFEDDGGSWLIEKPTLFACGQRDQFVPCTMSQNMGTLFTNLERYELNTTHWIMVEAPDILNNLLRHWLGNLDEEIKPIAPITSED